MIARYGSIFRGLDMPDIVSGRSVQGPQEPAFQACENWSKQELFPRRLSKKIRFLMIGNSLTVLWRFDADFPVFVRSTGRMKR
jgi:hypothetical protein